MKSAVIYDYILFVIFLSLSITIAIYSRYNGTKDRTKSDFVFGLGSVSMFGIIVSLAQSSLGVRAILGYPAELVYYGSGMWETVYGLILSIPLVCVIFVPVFFNLGKNIFLLLLV